MGKYKDLLLNMGLFAFTQVATKLITFFLVPLYTAYMSTADFGVTDMSTTVVSMVLPLATLSISDAVLRFAIDDKANRDRYISLGLVVVLFSVVVVMTLSPLLGLPFLGGLDRYRWLFVISYALSALQYFFNMLARALNEMKVIPISSIVTALLTAGCAVVFIAHMGMGATGFFYSLIAGNAGGVLCFFFVGGMFRHFHLRFETRDVVFLKRMFTYSIPMVPNALFWWMSSSINRFFITGMIGVSASGMFAAAQKIPGLLNTAAGIFQQAWQLSSFQQFRKTNISKFFSTVFRIYHAGIAIVASVIAVCSSLLSSFLLQKQFYQAWTLIPIMIVAFYFNILNSFYGTVYTATLKTKIFIHHHRVGGLVLCSYHMAAHPRVWHRRCLHRYGHCQSVGIGASCAVLSYSAAIRCAVVGGCRHINHVGGSSSGHWAAGAVLGGVFHTTYCGRVCGTSMVCCRIR